MTDNEIKRSQIAKALSAECRLLLLDWLCEPDRHFSDRSKLAGRRNAVAASNIAQKWNVAASTAKRHIALLKAAGLINVERHSRIHWITRNGRGIAAARNTGHSYVR